MSELRRAARLIWAGAVVFLGAAPSALVFAQGGPPLVADDPETPGGGHWEIDLAATLSRSSDRREWALPDVDINYGWGDRIQLKVDTPYVLRHEDGSTSSGLGPSRFGFKLRFLEHGPYDLAMSLYPQWTTHLIRSSVARGVADPGSEWLLPLEASVKLGGYQVDTEVGRRIAGDGTRSWEAGAIAGRNCVEKVECMLEVREIGIGDARKTLLNIGTRWKVSSALSVLAAVGHELGPARAEPDNVEIYLGVQLNR